MFLAMRILQGLPSPALIIKSSLPALPNVQSTPARAIGNSDADLVATYLKGSEPALQELINRYLPSIYRFVYRMTSHVQDAEDITQETFVKVWKHIRKYRAGESFKAWIFQIARHTAIDMLRKRKHLTFADFENSERENVLTETLEDTEPAADEIFAHIEDAHMLAALLAQLSPAIQEVLLLHYNEGLTFQEISKILAKPIDTVKSQHRRALLSLKELAQR